MKLTLKTLHRFVLVATLAGSPLAFSQSTPSTQDAPAVVFREPFTLKLRVDKKSYYQEQFRKIPYVNAGDVYLFAGDSFGINISIVDDEIARISYQPDFKKADLTFIFKQDKDLGETPMMLIIENKLKRRIYIDALMTVPDKKGIYKTSILPVEAGLSNFESWPHPIVQLVLRNLRLFDKPAAPP